MRRQFWHIINKLFPPSNETLHHLSRQDRPGLHLSIPKDVLTLGREAIENGLYEEALQHFDRILQQNIAQPWAWHGKGDAFQWLGDYKRALHAYEQASQYNPNEGLHWGGQANALHSLGNVSDAQRCQQQALRHNPSLDWMFRDWG